MLSYKHLIDMCKIIERNSLTQKQVQMITKELQSVNQQLDDLRQKDEDNMDYVKMEFKRRDERREADLEAQ
jgi:hypothetical protein